MQSLRILFFFTLTVNTLFLFGMFPINYYVSIAQSEGGHHAGTGGVNILIIVSLGNVLFNWIKQD
jgi:hypothetical protein